MTVNIMKMFRMEYLEKYFMTGQYFPLEMILQWKMGFGNGQIYASCRKLQICPLRPVLHLCSLSRFLCQVSYPLQILSGSTYCHSNAAAEVSQPKEKSLFPSQCKNLLKLRIRVSSCDIDLRHFWPSAEESWLSMN